MWEPIAEYTILLQRILITLLYTDILFKVSLLILLSLLLYSTSIAIDLKDMLVRRNKKEQEKLQKIERDMQIAKIKAERLHTTYKNDEQSKDI